MQTAQRWVSDDARGIDRGNFSDMSLLPELLPELSTIGSEPLPAAARRWDWQRTAEMPSRLQTHPHTHHGRSHSHRHY
jgi:hypothetical protein